MTDTDREEVDLLISEFDMDAATAERVVRGMNERRKRMAERARESTKGEQQ